MHDPIDQKLRLLPRPKTGAEFTSCMVMHFRRRYQRRRRIQLGGSAALMLMGGWFSLPSLASLSNQVGQNYGGSEMIAQVLPNTFNFFNALEWVSAELSQWQASTLTHFEFPTLLGLAALIAGAWLGTDYILSQSRGVLNE